MGMTLYFVESHLYKVLQDQQCSGTTIAVTLVNAGNNLFSGHSFRQRI
jgi:hypothetical protein